MTQAAPVPVSPAAAQAALPAPATLPVRAETRVQLARIGARPSVSTPRLAAITVGDAALALQVLAAAARVRREAGMADPAGRGGTVAFAILVLGTERFMALARAARTVERSLDAERRAPYLEALAVAAHAGVLARRCAPEQDSAERLQCAALAAFAGELLLLAAGPVQGAKILARHAGPCGPAENHDEGGAGALTPALRAGWSLGGTGSVLADLAARTAAAASAHGWYHERTLGAAAALAGALERDTDPVLGLARASAAEAARAWPAAAHAAAARELLLPPGPRWPDPRPPRWWETHTATAAHVPTTPDSPAPAAGPRTQTGAAGEGRAHGVARVAAGPRAGRPAPSAAGTLARAAVEALIERHGFERALFAVPDPDRTVLGARYAAGADAAALRAAFTFPLARPGLLPALLERGGGFAVDPSSLDRIAPRLPPALVRILDGRAALLMAVRARGRAVAVMFADAAHADPARVIAFKRTVASLGTALATPSRPPSG